MAKNNVLFQLKREDVVQAIKELDLPFSVEVTDDLIEKVKGRMLQWWQDGEEVMKIALTAELNSKDRIVQMSMIP